MTAEGMPELILTGDVYTVSRAEPWAEAVAVRDGWITSVGSADEIREMAGSGTRMIDLSGRLIVPGFQDAHIHPPEAGLELMRCYLHDGTGPEDYIDRIRTYAAAHPEAQWILGGGWALDHFPGGTPHRMALDAVVPDRPVFLPNRDGHGAWVNTRALELAAIGPGTADPPDGRIERDPDGSPSGTLHEGAMDLVERLIPPPGEKELERAILMAQEHLHSLGITAWQDAIVKRDSLAAYRALAADGRLSARVVAALWWERDRGEDQVEELIEARSQAPEGRLRATS